MPTIWPITRPAAPISEIELVGYKWVADSFEDKTVLRVTLYWRVPEAGKIDYHVFVHLVDGDGTLVSQSDGMPVYDRYPFSQWKPDEIVVDCYDIAVPSTLPLAETELRVGLYDISTGARLPFGESDHIKVKRPGESSTK